MYTVAMELPSMFFVSCSMKKIKKTHILLPWQEEIFTSAEEEDVSLLKKDKVTFALLVVVLIKNIGDLLVVVYGFVSNFF